MLRSGNDLKLEKERELSVTISWGRGRGGKSLVAKNMLAKGRERKTPREQGGRSGETGLEIKTDKQTEFRDGLEDGPSHQGSRVCVCLCVCRAGRARQPAQQFNWRQRGSEF